MLISHGIPWKESYGTIQHPVEGMLNFHVSEFSSKTKTACVECALCAPAGEENLHSMWRTVRDVFLSYEA